MQNLEQMISDLRKQIGHTRQQFLQAEMQTCVLAIDMARNELSAGRTDVALREIADVEKGIQVMHRFLAETPQEQRQEFSTQMTLLEDTLNLLKKDTDRAVKRTRP